MIGELGQTVWIIDNHCVKEQTIKKVARYETYTDPSEKESDFWYGYSVDGYSPYKEFFYDSAYFRPLYFNKEEAEERLESDRLEAEPKTFRLNKLFKTMLGFK